MTEPFRPILSPLMAEDIVKAALLENKDLSSQKIDVSTTDGVVVLKGSIPNAESAQQAISAATAVPGVKDVKNELKLGK